MTTPPEIASPPPPPRMAPPASPITAIDRTKIYYLFFDQGIDVASMRALRRQMALLVEAGVTEIHLVIDSPGGLIEPVLITYSFLRSLPARIDTHAQGFVQSAANVLFLAGETRTADRNARFMFHPVRLPVTGNLSEQDIRDRVTDVDTLSATVRQIYRDRTTMTDQEVEKFSAGQVFYTGEQAVKSGIIQSVEDLKLPGEQKAKIIFLD